MDIELLRETFQRAKNENGGLRSLGLSFYARLFAKYPAVRPLFTTPTEQQHKKLMASVGAIVAAVENPEALVPYLHAMGIRHLAYKTDNAHYPAVGENLVAVLGEHLSKEGAWTEDMKRTWQSALEFVSNVMIEAANDPAKYKTELAKAGYKADGFSKHGAEPWTMVAPAAVVATG
jgi:hemoglobin-like flavoprotein